MADVSNLQVWASKRAVVYEGVAVPCLSLPCLALPCTFRQAVDYKLPRLLLGLADLSPLPVIGYSYTLVSNVLLCACSLQVQHSSVA